MRKLNLIKTNSKKKIASRDSTPIIKFTNKSIDGFPRQISISDYSTTKSTTIQKRNQRTNSSFGYMNTETFQRERTSSKNTLGHSKPKSLNKNKRNNELASSTNQLWKKFPMSKIPFQNKIKKVQSNSKINPRINISKDTITQHSFIQPSNLQQRLNTNNDTSGYAITSSEKSSERLSNEKKNKLNNVYNEVVDLVSSAKEGEKELIIEELEKIYKTVVVNEDSTKDEMNKILEENKMIKEKNRELCKKIALIEKRCDFVIKDNEKLRKNFEQSNQALEKMKSTMSYFNSELNKLKQQQSKTEEINEIKSEDPSNQIYEESLDNISLAENLNINDQKINGVSTSVSSNLTKPSSKLQLNLKGVTSDFNQEFLENYSDFSPSWRKEADKMMMRNKKNH